MGGGGGANLVGTIVSLTYASLHSLFFSYTSAVSRFDAYDILYITDSGHLCEVDYGIDTIALCTTTPLNVPS